MHARAHPQAAERGALPEILLRVPRAGVVLLVEQIRVGADDRAARRRDAELRPVPMVEHGGPGQRRDLRQDPEPRVVPLGLLTEGSNVPYYMCSLIQPPIQIRLQRRNQTEKGQAWSQWLRSRLTRRGACTV